MQFSVVTPSLRNLPWLKLCVASVADQGVECEHIIQDAGSDDGTIEAMQGDPRVRFFVEKDNGMYDAINRGWRKSCGDIVAHLNCDEQYLPGALEAVWKFFQEHPDVDALFSDAVVVNARGEYLFHRKTQLPLEWHTRVCPLSTLTCATFFRRRLLERGFYFDTRYRYIGDRDQVVKMLNANVRMAVMRRFTSVFALTGHNISLNPDVMEETARFLKLTPQWIRSLKPLILFHHRMRRVLGGIYSQEPFRYSVFTPQSPAERVEHQVSEPTGRWKW